MIQRNLYMKRIDNLLNTEPIKIITGIRRCGKSCFLHMIMDKLIQSKVQKENIIYINFDEFEYTHIQNYNQLNELILKKTSKVEGKIYFFLDEIQNVYGYERTLNACKLKFDCDIIITGSNSKMLSQELATHLSGRYIEIRMYPFSFKEYVDYHVEKTQNQEIDKNKLLKEYIQYGGLPGLYEMDDYEKINYIHDIFNSIFLKDVVNRYNIRDSNLLNDLSIYLMNNIGNIFSIKSLKSYLSREEIKFNHNTLNMYLEYLENACFIHKVQRKDIKGRKIFKRISKYYITDHGFLRMINNEKNENIGHVIENIVYMELLRRGYDIKIGKIKDYEVDFICTKPGAKIYVQVCYLLIDEDVVEREFRPLEEIRDNYPKIVVSMDNFNFSRNGIQHMNLIDFLTINI